MSGNTFGRSEDRNVAETDFTPPGLELVDSKLWAPQSRPGSVVRRTLVDRLEISRAPVVTIVAPAGYGKTTLLRQWSDHHPTHVTWLSLDRHDDDPGVLIGYLVAALERIEPVDPRRRGTLLGEAAVDISGSVRRVAAWVSSIRTQFLMIIDQTEAIQTKVSSDLIAAVALNLPAGSRLALASRTEPPIPMARLRAEGQVEEISQTDLTMGDDEAAQLLAHAGVTLSAADVSTVVGHTEGWPVGLYLASLAITSRRIAERGAGAAWR